MRFLLEAGTEDLPSSVLDNLSAQLSEAFSRLSAEYRIAGGRVRTFVTVRRLVLLAEDIPDRQADLVTEVSGPPARVAFGPDGAITEAGRGYCRAHGVRPAELKTRRTGDRENVYYLKKQKGSVTRKLLPEIVPRLFAGLSYPLPMRWGSGSGPFIRPLTHLLCLGGDRTVTVEFAGTRSRPFTAGHPTLSPGKIAVKSIDGYFETLEENSVRLDAADRLAVLTGEVRDALPAGADFNPDDLAGLSRALEFPRCRPGDFDLSGIEFPPEAVSLVIRNLKCLPLHEKAGPGRVMPQFMIITDGRINDEIEAGFRRVLENRLEDARFFWEEDRAVSLEERLSLQERVVFQAGVGTMADYTRALTALASWSAAAAGLEPGEAEIVSASAALARLDITTSMVREFPELAGAVAAGLLEKAGHPENVCRAVREHQYPRFPGDRRPETPAGTILSFSDKLLGLCGLFTAGAEATGTSDPYGLRRLAAGLLETAWECGLRLSLAESVAAAFRAWGRPNPEDGEIVGRVVLFLRQRMENMLCARKFRSDLVSAALAAEGDRLGDYPARCRALDRFLSGPGGQDEIITFSRVTNIVAQAAEKGLSGFDFDPRLLQEEAEHNLFRDWRRSRPAIADGMDGGRYEEALASFSRLCPAVNRFFEDVLVMAPEEPVRNNRLAMLESIAAQLRRAGDITKIQARMRA